MNLKHKSGEDIPQVNNHIHTPYSFSAFDSVEHIFRLAENENIRSLGINDFYTADGYEEFNALALKNRIYPVFNIEFIGLSKDFQQKGIRINDPNNPGRIYISGKGLRNPFRLSEQGTRMLRSMQEESQRQIKEIIEKSNRFFRDVDVQISLDYGEIKRKYAKNLVRERHLARAVYRSVMELCGDDTSESRQLFKRLYSGKEPSADPSDLSAVENEIRSGLFKAGGSAFVPEDESAFFSIPQITGLIIDAGGIPCYPALLDDAKGNFTGFEKDPEEMDRFLKEMNIGCLEIIPNRNSLKNIEKFADFFSDRKYIIAFGTEHNAPGMIPLTPACRDNVQLSDKLKRLSYEATCVMAAHQALTALGREGFMDGQGQPVLSKIPDLAMQGDLLIKKMVG